MFCIFYLVKNRAIANNLLTMEVREKMSTDLESFEFQNFLKARLHYGKNMAKLVRFTKKYILLF
jgi:hypothetical protein